MTHTGRITVEVSISVFKTVWTTTGPLEIEVCIRVLVKLIKRVAVTLEVEKTVWVLMDCIVRLDVKVLKACMVLVAR